MFLTGFSPGHFHDKMIILLSIVKRLIMQGIQELSLDNKRQSSTQGPKVLAKLSYFLTEEEFINAFVT